MSASEMNINRKKNMKRTHQTNVGKQTNLKSQSHNYRGNKPTNKGFSFTQPQSRRAQNQKRDVNRSTYGA